MIPKRYLEYLNSINTGDEERRNPDTSYSEDEVGHMDPKGPSQFEERWAAEMAKDLPEPPASRIRNPYPGNGTPPTHNLHNTVEHITSGNGDETLQPPHGFGGSPAFPWKEEDTEYSVLPGGSGNMWADPVKRYSGMSNQDLNNLQTLGVNSWERTKTVSAVADYLGETLHRKYEAGYWEHRGEYPEGTPSEDIFNSPAFRKSIENQPIDSSFFTAMPPTFVKAAKVLGVGELNNYGDVNNWLQSVISPGVSELANKTKRLFGQEAADENYQVMMDAVNQQLPFFDRFGGPKDRSVMVFGVTTAFKAKQAWTRSESSIAQTEGSIDAPGVSINGAFYVPDASNDNPQFTGAIPGKGIDAVPQDALVRWQLANRSAWGNYGNSFVASPTNAAGQAGGSEATVFNGFNLLFGQDQGIPGQHHETSQEIYDALSRIESFKTLDVITHEPVGTNWDNDQMITRYSQRMMTMNFGLTGYSPITELPPKPFSPFDKITGKLYGQSGLGASPEDRIYLPLYTQTGSSGQATSLSSDGHVAFAPLADQQPSYQRSSPGSRYVKKDRYGNPVMSNPVMEDWNQQVFVTRQDIDNLRRVRNYYSDDADPDAVAPGYRRIMGALNQLTGGSFNISGSDYPSSISQFDKFMTESLGNEEPEKANTTIKTILDRVGPYRLLEQVQPEPFHGTGRNWSPLEEEAWTYTSVLNGLMPPEAYDKRVKAETPLIVSIARQANRFLDNSGEVSVKGLQTLPEQAESTQWYNQLNGGRNAKAGTVAYKQHYLDRWEDRVSPQQMAEVAYAGGKENVDTFLSKARNFVDNYNGIAMPGAAINIDTSSIMAFDTTLKALRNTNPDAAERLSVLFPSSQEVYERITHVKAAVTPALFTSIDALSGKPLNTRNLGNSEAGKLVGSALSELDEKYSWVKNVPANVYSPEQFNGAFGHYKNENGEASTPAVGMHNKSGVYVRSDIESNNLIPVLYHELSHGFIDRSNPEDLLQLAREFLGQNPEVMKKYMEAGYRGAELPNELLADMGAIVMGSEKYSPKGLRFSSEWIKDKPGYGKLRDGMAKSMESFTPKNTSARLAQGVPENMPVGTPAARTARSVVPASERVAEQEYAIKAEAESDASNVVKGAKAKIYAKLGLEPDGETPLGAPSRGNAVRVGAGRAAGRMTMNDMLPGGTDPITGGGRRSARLDMGYDSERTPVAARMAGGGGGHWADDDVDYGEPPDPPQEPWDADERSAYASPHGGNGPRTGSRFTDAQGNPIPSTHQRPANQTELMRVSMRGTLAGRTSASFHDPLLGDAVRTLDKQGYELRNANGELRATADQVRKGESIARTALDRATSGVLPDDMSDMTATVKESIYNSVRDQVKQEVESYKKNGMSTIQSQETGQRIEAIANAILKPATDIAEDMAAKATGQQYIPGLSQSIKTNAINFKSLADAKEVYTNDQTFRANVDKTGHSLEDLMSQSSDQGVTISGEDMSYRLQQPYGGSGAGRGGAPGLFGKLGNVGSALYGMYMMKRMWGMETGEVTQSMGQYANFEQANYPIAAFGGSSSNYIGSDAGYNARQQISQNFMGKAAMQEYGGFSNIGYNFAMSNNQGAARMLTAAETSIGAGAASAMALGTLANMAPGITGALGIGTEEAVAAGTAATTVGAVAGPLALGVAGAGILWAGADEGLRAIHPSGDYGLGADLQHFFFPAPGKAGTWAGMLSGGTWTPPIDTGKIYNQIVSSSKSTVSSNELRYGYRADRSQAKAAPTTDDLVNAGIEAGGTDQDVRSAINTYQTSTGMTPSVDQVTSMVTQAQKLGIGANDLVNAGATYASDLGNLPGTSGFANSIANFQSQVGTSQTALSQAQYTAAQTGQYGSQLQQFIPGGAANMGLGARIANQSGIDSQQKAGAAATWMNAGAAYLSQSGGSSSRMLPDTSAGAQQPFLSQLGGISQKLNPYQSQIAGGIAYQAALAGVNPTMMGNLLSNSGISNNAMSLVGQVAGGNLGAASYNSWVTNGDVSQRIYDFSGNPIQQTNGAMAMQMVLANVNSTMPTANGMTQGQLFQNNIPMASMLQGITSPSSALSALGVNPNSGFGSAFLNGYKGYSGTTGTQLWYSDQSYALQKQSAGIAAAGVALTQQYDWGSGTWDNPSAGSAWDLQNQQVALSKQSTMADFASQQKSMQLQNNYSIANEGIQLNQMKTSQAYTNESLAYQQSQALQSQSFSREQFQYTNQMTALSQGWGLIDIDEQIRYSSGRQRRDLIRQKGEMVTSNNLQNQQTQTVQGQQETVWKEENAQMVVEKQYNADMQKLDKESYDLNVKYRKDTYNLDEQNWSRKKKEYQEEQAIEDQMRTLQRKYEADQLSQQLASIALQSKEADLQKQYADATAKVEPLITNTIGAMNQLASNDNIWNVANAMKSLASNINGINTTNVANLSNLFYSTNSMSSGNLTLLNEIFKALTQTSGSQLQKVLDKLNGGGN